MKYLNNSTFDKLGYINEINRLFLHPVGLAMILEDGGDIKILDCRDRKEGLIFTKIDEQFKAKSELILENYSDRSLPRIQKYGWSIQPLVEKED